MTSFSAPAASPVYIPTQASSAVADSPSANTAGFTGAGLLSLLRHHPDARRKCGDNDAARQNGLQQVQIMASGTINVVWHWGVVTFRGAEAGAEFDAYLGRARA